MLGPIWTSPKCNASQYFRLIRTPVAAPLSQNCNIAKHLALSRHAQIIAEYNVWGTSCFLELNQARWSLPDDPALRSREPKGNPTNRDYRGQPNGAQPKGAQGAQREPTMY